MYCTQREPPICLRFPGSFPCYPKEYDHEIEKTAARPVNQPAGSSPCFCVHCRGEVDTQNPPLAINPDNFVSKVDNPYFPLVPGTTLIYRGETEGVPTRNEMVVTNDTKVILGVTTIVVHDSVYEQGVLTEDTLDWYAQDEDGNVWYFGEDTKELDENGNVISTEGSWEAGSMAPNPASSWKPSQGKVTVTSRSLPLA